MQFSNYLKVPRHRNLKRSIYVVAVVRFLAFVACVLFFLYFAASEADRIALNTEQKLVRAEVSSQMDIARRNQSQLAYWDDAYRAFRGQINQEFIEELADMQLDDFAIRSSLVVGSDLTIFADIEDGRVLDPGARKSLVLQNADLIKRAIGRYNQSRKKQAGGYIVPAGIYEIPDILPIAAIREFEGKLSIVTAQAILSDDYNNPVTEDSVRVFLAASAFDEKRVAAIANKTGLNNVGIIPILKDTGGKKSIPLPNGNLESVFKLVWQSDAPMSAIFEKAAPIMLALFSLVGITIWFVTRKYGCVIHDLEISEERNRFLASHDVLTGLPNRSKFDAEIESATAKDAREPENWFAVMCLDLDRFKSVNDTYGHHAGDVVIQTVATRLGELIADRGIIARMGGDEFSCMIRKDINKDELLWLAETMIEAVSDPIEFVGGQATIGLSIGVSCWPEHGSNISAIMRKADSALYDAKESGRGNVVFSQTSHRSNITNKAA